jgi:hypothetical protein
MNRFHLHLPDRLLDRLKAQAESLGLSVAETIRRQLDRDLVELDKQNRQPSRPKVKKHKLRA